MNKNQIEDIYPLSPMQQGMLFHTLYAPGSGVYVIQSSWTIEGHLDVEALKQAWQKVIDRHTALRTSFVWEQREKPLQIVHRQVSPQWEEHDWRMLTDAEQQDRLDSFLKQDRKRGFDLLVAPLIRISIITRGKRLFEYVLSFHHMLMDGWSAPMVLNEVFAFYNAFHEGRELHLPPPRPYRDFITWFRQQDLSRAEEFWRKELEGFTAPTPLVAYSAKNGEADRGEDFRLQQIWLDRDEVAQLHSFARNHRLTLNTLLQAVWANLLSRYSYEREIVFGATVSGRPSSLPGVESIVGLFINTLPVRVRVNPQDKILPWLKELQAKLAELREYEYSSLQDIQAWSKAPRGVPLFETIFLFENYPANPVSVNNGDGNRDLTLSRIRGADPSHYPISVRAWPGEKFPVQIDYNAGRFDDGTIKRMLGHVKRLLNTIIKDPEQRLSDLQMIDAEEREQMLYGWNDVGAHYEPGLCLHEMFERQAQQSPDAVALTFDDQSLSYDQLNSTANRLAHLLIESDAGPEQIVAICLDRSPQMVVAIVAALKSGAAYLPLDPAYPQERLSFMLDDAGASLLITDSNRAPSLASYPGNVIRIDQRQNTEFCDENPGSRAEPGNAAYVIYTSGSTGKPKGVVVAHQNVARLFEATRHWYGFGGQEVWSLFHSYGFDFSVWEIWGPLLHGGRLVVVDYWVSRNPEAFYELVWDQGVTVLNQTPSAFRQFMRVDERRSGKLGLKWVIFGGEALEIETLRGWMNRRGTERPRLVNMYGITETTVHVTYRELGEGDLGKGSVIGEGMRDLQVYILDERKEATPIGVSGEVYVGGGGVARGYLGRGDLTAERFEPDPYGGEEGGRVYRTGDIGRRLGDGEIEYLGRKDEQVKIRGFRIEIGEIEAVIMEKDGVREAVVKVVGDETEEQRLVAYVVSNEEDGVSQEELRRYLKEKLPEYMMPAWFVNMERLPLTSNGKVDRNALPDPGDFHRELGASYVAPQNDIEQRIALIWQEVLKLKRVGAHDNFFDLGGHSLNMVQVYGKLRKIFTSNLTMVNLFEYPTINLLAKWLSDREKEKTSLEKSDARIEMRKELRSRRIGYLEARHEVKMTYEFDIEQANHE